MESFEDFVRKYKVNPLTNSKIIIAKNSSYIYQRSEESYVLLLPLAVNDPDLPDDDDDDATTKNSVRYMYVLAYVDPKTNLTEYYLRVSCIENLIVSGNRRVHTFDASKCESTLDKEVQCIAFIAEYFDPKINKCLYMAEGNARMHVPTVTRYDTEKIEYQQKCGYIEIRHQRAVVEKKMHSYVQMLCCQSSKGVRHPAKVTSILSGEFHLVSEYLKFVTSFYKFGNMSTMESFGLHKKYLGCSRNDVLKTITKIEKLKKQQKKKHEDYGSDSPTPKRLKSSSIDYNEFDSSDDNDDESLNENWHVCLG